MSLIKHTIYFDSTETILSLEETDIFVTEDGQEYRDHTKTNFVVEHYGFNDLDPREHTYWGGLRPTYFATYYEALLCFAEELKSKAEAHLDIEDIKSSVCDCEDRPCCGCDADVYQPYDQEPYEPSHPHYCDCPRCDPDEEEAEE